MTDEAKGFEIEELTEPEIVPALHCGPHCHMGFSLGETDDQVEK